MSDFFRYIGLALILMFPYWTFVHFYPEAQGFALGIFYWLAYSFGEYFGKQEERKKHE